MPDEDDVVAVHLDPNPLIQASGRINR
jgi:hypothetical protein